MNKHIHVYMYIYIYVYTIYVYIVYFSFSEYLRELMILNWLACPKICWKPKKLRLQWQWPHWGSTPVNFFDTNQVPTDQALYGNLQLRAELLHEVLQGERRDSDEVRVWNWIKHGDETLMSRGIYIYLSLYTYTHLYTYIYMGINGRYRRLL